MPLPVCNGLPRTRPDGRIILLLSSQSLCCLLNGSQSITRFSQPFDQPTLSR